MLINKIKNNINNLIINSIYANFKNNYKTLFDSYQFKTKIKNIH